MIKKIDFKKLFLPALVYCGAVFVIGLFILLVFGGKTYPEYTISNLRFSYFIKAGFSVLFVFILTTLYFFIHFNKKGVWLGIFSIASATVNALVSFFLCVIFRANLNEITLALILISVLLTYMVTVVFASNISAPAKEKKKKKAPPVLTETICEKALRAMLLPIAFVAFVTIIAFVIALIFGASELALYALPMIVSAASSVILTLTFACKFYKS
ncbi:MAG: hypothetical protein E7566_06040 [Ruminococcaceae bacterium]|nr:hypothetical protein [Oscillospiraceae bacterium]